MIDLSNLTTYNATFLGYECNTDYYNKSEVINENVNNLMLKKGYNGFTNLSLDLKIKSTSRAICEDKINLLVDLFLSVQEIKGYKTDRRFTGVLSKFSSDMINDTTFKLTLNLVGKEESIEQKSLTFNNFNSGVITYTGAKSNNCILEITPSVDAENVEIGGLTDSAIVLKGLKADTVRVIDGVKGTILEGTTNKFSDTELFEFPSLKNGTNTITCSQSTLKVVVKYNERY